MLREEVEELGRDESNVRLEKKEVLVDVEKQNSKMRMDILDIQNKIDSTKY